MNSNGLGPMMASEFIGVGAMGQWSYVFIGFGGADGKLPVNS